MFFLNAPILTGLALTAIPIVLHFLFKQKPKKLLFPALQLIQQRRKQSMRRLRMKHFWLLLLRILVLVLLVLAIARPSLPPANYRLSTFELSILLLVILVGIIVYFSLLYKVRQRISSRHVREEQQTRLRNFTTAGTLLSILAFVGCPYQQRISGELVTPRPIQDIDLPVAAVLIFDTSLSMSYLQEGQTSLERAQEIASEHLQSLPAGSRIAIADNSNDHPILFQSTMISAQNRIENLQIHQHSFPLDERLQTAIRAQEDDRTRTLSDQDRVQTDARKDRYVRRIYVLSDMAKSAWKERTSEILKSDLESSNAGQLYFLDVGQENPQNISITDIQLSRERIPLGGDLIVSATVLSTGEDVAAQNIELRLQNSQGNASKVGQQTVQLDNGIAAQLSFSPLNDLRNRSLHGEVRLTTSDPLSFDNVRFFSAEVSIAPKVLVVGPDYDAVNEWILALAPFDSLNAGRNKFQPEYIPISKFRAVEFSDYTAICLMNCPGSAINDDLWFQLSKYVDNGGGLVIVLGATDQQIQPTFYNRARAQVFLPATIDFWNPQNPNNEWRFQVEQRNHPMFWKFRQLENYGPFTVLENLVNVERFWTVTPAEEANVIARFTDEERSPAILERTYGQGRTIMLMTGANNPEDRRAVWSTLASPIVSDWVFLAFVDQMTEYVSRFTDIRHNYLLGEVPVIPVDSANADRILLLKLPGARQIKQSLPAFATSLTLEPAARVGHYDLYPQQSRIPLRGFSVNASSSESDLSRFTDDELDQRFGSEQYEVASNLDELKNNINAADIGQEVYPMLLMLVVVAFLGEHFVANYFYGGNERVESLEPSVKMDNSSAV